MHLLSKILSALTHLVFPEFCCGCNKLGSLLCDNCYERLGFLSLPVPLKLEKIYLNRVDAALLYDNLSRQLIAELKYRSVKDVGKVLGQLMFYTLDLPPADIITAVPLHPKRQDQRGFNQAEIIARELAEKMELPYMTLLKRVVNTEQQAKKHSREERLSALSEAFELAVPSTLISGKHIILVDDVVTTGSTLNVCANVLKSGGSAVIFGSAVASR